MSSNKTANLQLNQWQAGDAFLRTEFNEDNRKIDAGVQAAKQAAVAAGGYVVGSYVGDYVVGRVISLGFMPRAVLVLTAIRAASNAWSPQQETWVALRDKPAYYYSNSCKGLSIVENGFSAYPQQNPKSEYCVNMPNVLYYYIAFR